MEFFGENGYLRPLKVFVLWSHSSVAKDSLPAIIGVPSRAVSAPPKGRAVVQPGRTLAWGARGREFESRRPDHHKPLKTRV